MFYFPSGIGAPELVSGADAGAFEVLVTEPPPWASTLGAVAPCAPMIFFHQAWKTFPPSWPVWPNCAPPRLFTIAVSSSKPFARAGEASLSARAARLCSASSSASTFGPK